MPGVGKTLSLIGLGHDEDIRNHFEDGVLYMCVGAAATVGHVTSELCKIMRVTGANTTAAEVQTSNTLADAVSNAAIWFHGKQILFLIDDIWPIAASPDGYLPDLEGLLQGSPESRIVVSTRFLQVATKGGSHVDFGARDPCGQISMNIFNAHAAPNTLLSDGEMDAAQDILRLCSGLPIALSVAGAAVSLRISSGVGLKYACEMYLKELSAEVSLYPGDTVLESAIRLSLAALAADWEKRESRMHESASFSLSELYTSLCILVNQQFVPVSVLSRMWNVSETKAETICTIFASMSLAKISVQILDGHEQCGLLIHDLYLDYCCQTATHFGVERE